jgi:hypothetical protein
MLVRQGNVLVAALEFARKLLIFKDFFLLKD